MPHYEKEKGEVAPFVRQRLEAISAAEIGRASLVGQPVHLLSPLVPSTYLLVALVGVELGDHQRFTLKWTIITEFILLAIVSPRQPFRW